MTLTLNVDLPADLAQFRLPDAVASRLRNLLDRQDAGQPLTVRNARRRKDWSICRNSLAYCGCGRSAWPHERHFFEFVNRSGRHPLS